MRFFPLSLSMCEFGGVAGTREGKARVFLFLVGTWELCYYHHFFSFVFKKKKSGFFFSGAVSVDRMKNKIPRQKKRGGKRGKKEKKKKS